MVQLFAAIITCFSISALEFTEVRFVRNVAGRKKMFCASFQLPDKFLFGPAADEGFPCNESQNVAEIEENNQTQEKSSEESIYELEPNAKRKKLEMFG